MQHSSKKHIKLIKYKYKTSCCCERTQYPYKPKVDAWIGDWFRERILFVLQEQTVKWKTFIH